jgi:hypothetical protein
MTASRMISGDVLKLRKGEGGWADWPSGGRKRPPSAGREFL